MSAIDLELPGQCTTLGCLALMEHAVVPSSCRTCPSFDNPWGGLMLSGGEGQDTLALGICTLIVEQDSIRGPWSAKFHKVCT